MGFGVDLTSPLTETEAGEVTVAGLKHVVIEKGCVDPSEGIGALRKALDLPRGQP